eukprot:CAMPEP_0184343356 /NCGR_PEP_ID=MMETSP1089-20130417/11885_1 /TAXON_ID=38269 ORGANISM="Gloeochaete wittrockiana, Strain SAG46.84" /NCGR_SAMPLE_ID=MMETSP1089 /ASSEMBLY_ACC=CAM_ASM_000445 /LENGTH=482 /DNA_ID=CAMNT_0026672617 /DNA_START=30 /DNA_END=1474 /DNA_ORIENTATION=-
MMMKAVVLTCLLLSVLSFAAEVELEDGVLVLTQDNFDEVIASNNLVLVEFYAPWCGHCKKLTPEYAAAAQALAAKGSSVKLAKVDATVHAELGNRFGVRGYPTLYFFRDGQKSDYKGGRDSAAIQSWIAKNSVTTLPVLTTEEEIAKLTSGRAVLFYTEKAVDAELFNIAQNVEAFEFAIVNGALVTAELKEKVQLFAPHLTAPVVADRAEVDEAFLYANGYDVVFEYQREDWTRISQSKAVLTITVVDYSDEALKTSVISALRAVSTEFPNVALSYGDTKSWGPSASNMGATGTKYPTVIAVTTPQHTGSAAQLVWNEENEFNEANLRVWLASILDGSVVPFKKSEPLPESNDGPVKTLVHKNFDEITTANNVFVEFYAPWCGHCKSLAPIWDQLGQHFKDAEADVTIAKIDATANYVDGSFGVTGFPTLIFLKADGTRVPFKGGRTFDELVAFVNEQVPSAAAPAAATEDAHAGHSHNEL